MKEGVTVREPLDMINTFQSVQAHARSSGCCFPSVKVALCQHSPSSALTSARTMPLPPPEYEYPLRGSAKPSLDRTACTSCVADGIVMADCTGCSCRLGIFSTSIPSKLEIEGPNPFK